MTCEDMIYSNDFADYMVNYLSGMKGAEEVYRTGCLNTIIENIAILHIPKTENTLTNLETTPYSFVPKLFGLMDSTNMEAVGVKQVQNPNALGLDGKNVIVGIVDTGIDYTNPLFLDKDGNTRIGMLWDQTLRGLENSDGVPVPFYGTVFSKERIDAAIKSDETYTMLPSKDEDGHGTFLAGIAAGGENRENDFVGIAKESELAVVKLKEAKPYLRDYFGIKDNVKAYSETDIIYAVDYLLKYADAVNRPISILIGLGSSNGGHLGLTFIERYFSDILENVGIMISVPAGNEGNARLHYFGEMKEHAELQEVEVNVDAGQEVLTLEFWGNAPTTFAIGMVSPEGDRIERIPPRFGKEELIRLPLAGTTIYVAYQLIETFSGEELIFIRLTHPTPGIWRFLVYADEGKQRTFNMWMPLRQFLQPQTYFLRADTENTITVPGNADLVMTMTTFNHINGSIYAEAGRGYSARNQVKPDLAAPGVNITGPGLRHNFVRKTGTSIAAAHSAGMMALFLQWDFEHIDLGPFYAGQIQSFFLRSAVRDIEVEYPNVVWGYGIMNIERVFNEFRVTG